MKTIYLNLRRILVLSAVLFFILINQAAAQTPTPAFPGADGFGRFAPGARGAATQEVYVVTNLNDSGPGSFRDAVSQPGRIVVFAVGGIIRLSSPVVVAANTTIAGQTAPGDGVVLYGRRVTFSGADNTIARYLRIRLGNNAGAGRNEDASGIANGANMIFDHMSFSWGVDEVFSINWDGKGNEPTNITVQNSIIGQGLHRHNHSAGGLMETPNGKISLLKNLYVSNKTRNPKVKGVNEFVNNIVYNYGNANNPMGHTVSGDGYIMGGSGAVSEVNIINNYFVGGPLTPESASTPFSRGTGTFNLYGAGNYFDNNKNGVLDGALVPYNETGYPGIAEESFKTQPYAYPMAAPTLSALEAYDWVMDHVGATYPYRDEVDALMVDEVASRGTKGLYVYLESDLPLTNGGLGEVFGAPAPLDTDGDGMPDAWEDAHGLDKNNKQDAVAFSSEQPGYLNIEVYINSLVDSPAPEFLKHPTEVTLTATSVEEPASSTVVINWKDNSDNEANFVLERSTDGSNFTAVAEPAANATTYTDTDGLLPNATYHYRLKAVNEEEASAYSVVAVVQTPPIPAAPSLPTSPSPANNYQYASLNNGGLALTWAGSDNTTTYEVYTGTSAESLSKKGDMAYSVSPSFNLTDLTENTTYFWRIDATNDKGTTVGTVWSFRTVRSIPEGMVGHWAFDEPAEENDQILDSSPYENHGVLGLDGEDQSIRVAGKVDMALDFATAATDMYAVSVPNQDQLFLDQSSFSLSFWMKASAAMLPQDNNTSAYLLAKGSFTKNEATGATGKRFNIEFKNKQFRFAIDDDNDANGGGKDELQTDGTPFFTDEWVHVVAIRDVATNKLLLYRNGDFVGEVPITKALSGIGEESALILGNIGELEFESATATPAPYKGMLDELKIFNYALSPLQIREQYHTSPLPLQTLSPTPAHDSRIAEANSTTLAWQGGLNTTGYKVYFGTDNTDLPLVADVPVATATYQVNDLTANTTYHWRVDAVGEAGATTGEVWSFTTAAFNTGLVGHWKLDETGGTAAADASGNGATGTLTGMSDATWTSGKHGGALQFGNPASTGGIIVPDAEQFRFDQNAFTISMWVKIPANTYLYSATDGKDTYLIHKGTFEAGTGKWYGIQVRDGKLTFAIDDGNTKTNIDVNVAGAPYNFFNDEWRHVVAVRDTEAKQIKLYIDNTLAGSKAYTTLGIGKADPLLIGNSAENKPYRDVMDDVRLYNYALTEAEIGALFSPVLSAGNEKAVQGNKLIMYPNPVSGSAKVEFRLAKKSDFALEVFDLRGALVKRISSGKSEANQTVSQELNASNFAPGIYLVKLVTKHEVVARKIVVQK
ncbi:T9SS type A sorting domain-containing protein [Pontibacter qinzhouensis]|uniref:T9SS type A sorting domain-containing protein n=1 Tax=Pontibacter qinzhouensis TaxID=2603253 RepID=A0A5C8J5M0_9BACT|nr:LamG-like jellyroll fold domain-containing protein [Pontibacter qinzhouensis]TXK32792.1 T9SS type A sorting domain-containing protein [Pontibacter qinzhouensis]